MCQGVADVVFLGMQRADLARLDLVLRDPREARAKLNELYQNQKE